MRSPIIVRWPGVIEAGRLSNFSWAFWDFLPTVAELAGTEAPNGIDGESIVPTLLGHVQPEKEYLQWTWVGSGVKAPEGFDTLQGVDGLAYFRNAQDGETIIPAVDQSRSGFALRSGEWKIIVPHCRSDQFPSGDEPTWVFHLPQDPFETSNLNHTEQGKQKIAELFSMAKKHNLTCNCFQC